VGFDHTVMVRTLHQLQKKLNEDLQQKVPYNFKDLV